MKISTTRDRTQGKITLPSVWRGTVLRVAAVLFWILLWAAAAHKVGLPVLLPSPLSVAQRLVQLCVTADFWMTVFASLVRILLGFFCGVLFGTLLAVMAWRSDIAQEMIRPMLGVLKATPVASFIILALVWIDTQILAAVISFIMVLPLVYHNVREGFDAADTKLLEMARMLPFFLSAVSSALGYAWKSGIAAEVLGRPAKAIGKQIYDSKIYLETVDLFAWTIVVILMSVMLEKLMLWLVKRIGKQSMKVAEK